MYYSNVFFLFNSRQSFLSRVALALSCILIAILVANWFSAIATIALRPTPWAMVLGALSGFAIALSLIYTKPQRPHPRRTFQLDGLTVSAFPRQAAVAFVSSFASLLITVLLTMFAYWLELDWLVLLRFLVPITLLSTMVAVFFFLAPVERLGRVIVGGASSAFAIAAAYVYVGIPFFAG